MKYASFLAADGSPTWGIVADGNAHDLGPTGLDLAPDLKAAVASGLFGTVGEQFRLAPARRESDVEFLPAILEPA